MTSFIAKLVVVSTGILLGVGLLVVSRMLSPASLSPDPAHAQCDTTTTTTTTLPACTCSVFGCYDSNSCSFAGNSGFCDPYYCGSGDVCLPGICPLGCTPSFCCARCVCESLCPLDTQWGSSGGADGQFSFPEGVAVDGSGNILVADTRNNRIQKFTNTGTFLMKWGSTGNGDGELRFPAGVAVDPSGNVFVAEQGNNRIQKFTDAGIFLTKWGSPGSGDGEFDQPVGIAADASGNVFVADSVNRRIQKFTNTGTFLMKWGSVGSGDGQFNGVWGVAVDGAGNVFVADTPDNSRIQKFDSAGNFLTKWGNPGNGDGQFNQPIGLAVDAMGNVFVADSQNARVQKFTNDGTFVGTVCVAGFYPYGVAVNRSSGSLFVAALGGNGPDDSVLKFACPLVGCS